MGNPAIYVIEYHLQGAHKTFVIRADGMDNAQAWHWASCDAGIGTIPKSSRDKVKRITRPLAERYGLTDVQWRPSTQIDWTGESSL